jgi:TIR domain
MNPTTPAPRATGTPHALPARTRVGPAAPKRRMIVLAGSLPVSFAGRGGRLHRFGAPTAYVGGERRMSSNTAGPQPTEMSKLQVFISWAGKQAEIIAKGFRDHLPSAVNAVDLFMSEVDIDRGTRWHEVLTNTLHASTYGIVCLTDGSMESIWVAFETGVIAKAVGPVEAKKRIWTYILGLESRDIELTPYAVYQRTNITKPEAAQHETLKLIRSINALSPDDVHDELLQRKFDRMFWPDFSKVIEEARKLPIEPGRKHTPTDSELLTEILQTTRSIQQQLQPRAPTPFLLKEELTSIYVRYHGALSEDDLLSDLTNLEGLLGTPITTIRTDENAVQFVLDTPRQISKSAVNAISDGLRTSLHENFEDVTFITGRSSRRPG